MGNYWNDNYWRRHLAEPERMDIFEELWIGKHQELIDKLNKGHALDLGCGIGQFTRPQKILCNRQSMTV